MLWRDFAKLLRVIITLDHYHGVSFLKVKTFEGVNDL